MLPLVEDSGERGFRSEVGRGEPPSPKTGDVDIREGILSFLTLKLTFREVKERADDKDVLQILSASRRARVQE